MMVVSFDEISFYQRYSVFTNTVIFVNKTTIISGFIAVLFDFVLSSDV